MRRKRELRCASRSAVIEMYYGWLIVSATFVMLFFSTGIGFYTFSVFLIPLNGHSTPRDGHHRVNSVVAIMGASPAPQPARFCIRWGPGS
jgi:hypothetical protein